MSTQAQSPASEFAEFGQRLIDLGMAMKRDQTTVRDLQASKGLRHQAAEPSLGAWRRGA